MKKSLMFLVLTYFSIVGLYAVGEGDQINMAITPIRDEFQVGTGQSTIRQITFYNIANVPYTVYITTEDCEPGTNYGTPVCTPVSGTGVDSTKSSTWITPSETGLFVVGAGESRVITYTVNVPVDATPGGHYGAIFFNNPETNVAGTAVQMNRRIGMLYLLTVPGEIIVNTSFGDILIDGPGGGGGNQLFPSTLETLFSAPSMFFEETLRRFMMVFDDEAKTAELLGEINPLWEKPTLKSQDDFTLTLKIPVENTGNTHIRPTGKIYLRDENGEQLKRIGKQAIVNENGVFIGETVVDYLPINDEGGNVLPNTDRTYSVDWKGFAYDDIDTTNGRKVVKFESPNDYYSRINSSESQFLYPWEKLAIRYMSKNLQADVELSYKNPRTGLDEVYSFELPVPVEFKYIAKTLNWSLIILILLVTLLAYQIIKRNRRLDELEYETHHLEDEIHALERARDIISKKQPPKKPTKKEVVTPKKTVQAEEKDTKPKTSTKSPSSKTPAKSPTTAKKRPTEKAPPKKESPEETK